MQVQHLVIADKSENNQRNLLQVVVNFAIYLGNTKSIDEVNENQDITDFLLAIKMKNDNVFGLVHSMI